MSSSLAYRVLFVIPNAPLVIPSAVEESLPHRPEGRALRPFICGHGGAGSSSATTPAAVPVTIGAAKLENVVPGSKKHIEGSAYPMYGKIKGVDRRTSPDVEMHHLAALVAIKVKNATSGTIKIDDVEFGMPRIVSKDPITQKKTVIDPTPLLGECTADLTGDNTSLAVNGTNKYPTTKAVLNETCSLEPDGEITVYMAVCPIATNGKTISIKVNGSQRTLKMTKDVLTPGKVTTFKVDVKEFEKDITNNLSSNAFDFISTGDKADNETSAPSCNMVSLSSGFSNQTGYTINGQACDALYVSTSSEKQTMKVTGWAKDMINALPLSFYASGLDNVPTAMTIQYVNLWLPEYATEGYFSNKKIKYQTLKKRTQLNKTSIGTLISLAGIVMEGLKVTSNGLERDCLVNFVDPNTITFNGIPTNGYLSNKNLIVLSETNTHKSITPALINSFLSTKFSTNEYKASYLGLVAMVKAIKSSTDGSLTYQSYVDAEGVEHTPEQMSGYATTTANAIYNKILGVLTGKVGDTLGESLMGVVFASPTDLIHKLRDMKFELAIQTYPYADEYPTSSTTYAPIAFWEMRGTPQN